MKRWKREGEKGRRREGEGEIMGKRERICKGERVKTRGTRIQCFFPRVRKHFAYSTHCNSLTDKNDIQASAPEM